MIKHNQKEKMTQEISIHRSLSHPNIVTFHGFFEDHSNIYIVLELCKKRVRIKVHLKAILYKVIIQLLAIYHYSQYIHFSYCNEFALIFMNVLYY